jgi:beta-galactosidase
MQGAIAAERIPFLQGWEFQRAGTDIEDPAGVPGKGWRAVDLPHDWSIESPPSPGYTTGGGGGFFPAGSGWYRKSFRAPEEWRQQNVSLYFGGVYRNAEIWLNGSKIGEHAYGYTPFRLELSPHLLFQDSNELVVRVVNEPQPNSRWYSGSGIYRPVWIEVRPEVHFEPESLFAATTRLTERRAAVRVTASIANAGQLQGGESVEFKLFGPDSKAVASSLVSLENPKIEEGENLAVTFDVSNPMLWSPDSPNLYRLQASLWRMNEVVETVEASIGLRAFRWSSNRGLQINGVPVELFGGNVHHDHGPLGAAAYTEAEWRKARILRDTGFNAVRTAHNPPSDAFLAACDHLGLLVIDEAFDGWAVHKTAHDYADDFAESWEDDLRAMVLRDRNHPSVVMWSIGNEVYERGDASGIEIAHRMAAAVRELDTTRPLTIGLNGLGKNGDWSRLDTIFDALGAAGYNYELERHANDHERRPNRIIYASESYQNEAFANWKISSEHSYVIGDFVWSAIDYLGEAGIGRVFPSSEEARPHWVGDHYPYHGAVSGDIGITGNRKPISHYRNIVWDRGETLYAAVLVPTPDGQDWNLTKWSVPPALATWTWPGQAGRALTLEVYSRHPDVAVFLDGELLGTAPTTAAQEFRARFSIPYRPGRIEVVAGDEEFVLETAQAPAALRFVDPAGLRIRAGQDVYFAMVEIADSAGTWHPAADRPIRFSISGGEILAIGSDDLAATESYRDNPRQSYQGRSMVVFSVAADAPEVMLRAEAEGLAPAVVRLR